MEATTTRYTQGEQDMYDKASQYIDGLPAIGEILGLAQHIHSIDNPGTVMNRRDCLYFAEALHYAIHKSDHDFGRISPKNVFQAAMGKPYAYQLERMVAMGVAPAECTTDLRDLESFMQKCKSLSKGARELFAKWLEICVVDPAEIDGTLGINVLKVAADMLESAKGYTEKDIAEAIHAGNKLPYSVERRDEKTGKMIEAIAKPDFESALQTVRSVATNLGFSMGTHDTCFCYHAQPKAFKPSTKYIVGIWKDGKRIINIE